MFAHENHRWIVIGGIFMEKKLPTDAHVLVSFLNTKLRDEYDSLDALCDDYDVKDDELILKALSIDYTYDPELNQFK